MGSIQAAFVLILTAHANDGSIVGTSQAMFDNEKACISAGNAARLAGGTATWKEGYPLIRDEFLGRKGQIIEGYGLHDRIQFICKSTSEISE